MNERAVLLNPGPVTLTPRVREAMMRGDWCHREPEFAALTREINAGLASVYAAMADSYDAVMLTGSGTSAVEGMLGTFAPDDNKTLVAANGVYGERMAAILAAQRKPCELLQRDWLEPLDVDAIVAALERDPSITHLATVHHETTTGRLNDLDAVGRLCRERDVALLLDGVSSFGAERIETEAWNLAAVAATANKCLHAVPGISFVVARRSAWSAPHGAAPSVYLDLRAYHAGQHGTGFSPFTQSVQVAFALREALAELKDDGGWASRGQEYARRATRIEQELARRNVSTLLNKKLYSSVLWSYRLPVGFTYEQLHERLKAAGFVIYAGQGALGSEIFRIAHMGDIRDADLDRLVACFAGVLPGRDA